MRRIFIPMIFIWGMIAACSVDTGTKTADKDDEPSYIEYRAVDKAATLTESDESYYIPFHKTVNGKTTKFRISIMQSGSYFSYSDVFEGMLKGLMTIGWIKNIPPLMDNFDGYEAYEDGKNIANILTELSKYDYSDYLIISPDDFFDLRWQNDNVEDPQFQRLISPESDIDLIISYGSQMGAIISKPEEFHTPVMVDSISDPIQLGVLASVKDSGKNYLTGVINPEQDIRQIRLFNSVIKFNTLGIIYEDSELGRTYGAVDDIMRLSAEYGFKVIAETDVLPDPEDEEDEAAWEEAEARYVAALDRLCPQVDAVYLAIQAGLSGNSLPEIINILDKHKTPSFIMDGKDFVRKGILLGESDSNLISRGIFNAKKIINILKGRNPRELNQVFEHVPHIAINLGTAQKIGYDVPIDIIASADEVFVVREISHE